MDHDLSFNSILRTLDEAEVISFDIFDTLVTRDFYKPVDLFRYMEERYNWKNFGNLRPAAEALARDKYNDFEDIDVSKIYEFLETPRFDLECHEEKRCCVRNKTVFEIYRYALEKNKRLIAISDMYLDIATVKEILHNCGYNEFEKIYVSGELNATKASGALYGKVLKDLNVPFNKIVHIGDNRHSDFEMAIKSGIKAIHLPSPREQLMTCVNKTLVHYLEKHATPQSSLMAGLIAQNYTTICKENYWYRFGYIYAGIVLFGFMTHVKQHCRRHSIKRVYFMSRDGKIMQSVFNIVAEKDGIESKYMYGSRRMFFVASLQSLKDDELAQLIDSDPHVKYKDIVNRLGFDWLVDKAKKHFGDLDRKIISVSDREALKNFFLKYRQDILEEARVERNNLLKYLKHIGFFDNKKRLIVDVGWGCSSQKYLEKILKEKVQGIYFGTHGSTYAHEWLYGYFFHQGKPHSHNDLVMQALPVVELLFMGDHYSVTKIDENIKPVFHRPNRYEEHRIAIARDIHRGAIGFAKAYRMQLEKYDLEVDHGVVSLVLKALLKEGSEVDIRSIAEVPHAALMGESSYEPIIKNLNQTPWEYFINIVKGRLEENQCLWPSGRRRYNILKKKRYITSIETLSNIFFRLKHCFTYTPKICIKKIWKKFKAHI